MKDFRQFLSIGLVSFFMFAVLSPDSWSGTRRSPRPRAAQVDHSASTQGAEVGLDQKRCECQGPLESYDDPTGCRYTESYEDTSSRGYDGL